ncbi:unnamed protein product [Phytophthora fragariaefolia]|uniref:Unnamed protein product n=1 Tax=Phytophthora fragariaefolia TaxID=1490495 RepID=A0A9W7D161_9STRA|nr:unnamed protein product [Phytophthora fragariaefolia]
MRSTGRRRADRSTELEHLRVVDPQRRSTIGAAAQACFLPPTTLFRQLRFGKLRVETSVAKPMLSDDNKESRIAFSVGYPKPVHRRKGKRHIPKVMVLAAVARPRHEPVTGKFFDGNLGVWAFLTHEPAKRSSRNRPAGTMVPYPLAVNKGTYRNMLVEHVPPSIRAKIPRAAEGRHITVQQDNASPHIQPDDVAWRQAVNASGCEVHLRFQPPNSPDMNVLDLAVFSAL